MTDLLYAGENAMKHPTKTIVTWAVWSDETKKWIFCAHPRDLPLNFRTRDEARQCCIRLKEHARRVQVTIEDMGR